MVDHQDHAAVLPAGHSRAVLVRCHETLGVLTVAHGAHTVTVSAANVLGDALPNSGDATEQDFALVISNAVLVGGE